MAENQDFLHYKDSQRARKIWREYISEIQSSGIENRASSVLAECFTSDSLDVQLDLLVTNSKRGVGSVSGPVDPDSDGSWANVVKAYEDLD